MSKTCPFCDLDRPPNFENEYCVAILDAFPVSIGHTLIIPRRHVESILDLSEDEYEACFQLVREAAMGIGKQFETTALNIGVNCGAAAGQTIEHAHIHVIPRRKGDVENPRGGVRHVIPSKGFY